MTHLLGALVILLVPLASFAQAPSPPPDWIDEFPSVTEVAHAAYEELKVTAQRSGIDPNDDDSIAVSLAGTFVVLRQIMLLKYNEEPPMAKGREEKLRKLVASYLEAELTIGRGWAGRRGYIMRGPPTGMGCRDEQCYRRWFLQHLHASSGRAEYRERVLNRLFPCGTLAKELNDLRQKHATTVPYMPSPATTLRIEKEVAGVGPAGCAAYGGDSRQRGLCDGWTPPPPSAGKASGSGAFRTSSAACQLIVLTKVKIAKGGGLLVSIAPKSAKEGDVVTFSVSPSAKDKPDGSPAFWEKAAKIVKGSTGLQAVVAWDAGAQLTADLLKPFLIVDTTSQRSSGPVHCEQPTTKWEDRHQRPEPNGLHGRYPSVDVAAMKDQASAIALGRTGTSSLLGTGAPEQGFVIVRDLRRAGAYYTTPPRSSSQAGSGTAPRFGIWDYKVSMHAAFANSCENIEDFEVAATVHTHPKQWGDIGFNGFSASDFQQAIQLREQVPAFEKIVMLNKGDEHTYVFIPCPGDAKFWDWQLGPLIEVAILDTITTIPDFELVLWHTYNKRTYVPSRGEAVKGCVK